MENPFRTGEVVFDEFFTDRADEVARVRRAMRGRERLLLHGERRLGKSSVIRQASLPLQKEGATVIWVDLWTTRSLEEVIRRTVAAVPYGWALKDRFQLALARFGLEPRVTVDSRGAPGFSLGAFARALSGEEARERFRSLLETLDDLAEHAEQPVVLVLDEFQQLEVIEEGGGALLRGLMQHARNLSFVLAGSTLSLIDELVGPRGPFFNIERLDVGPIEADHLAGWIEDRLRTSGVASVGGVGEVIVGRAAPRTEDIIRLARACFYRGTSGDRIDPATVDIAFSQLVSDGAGSYEVLWNELPDYQRSVLRAVAAGVEELHGSEARVEFGLPTSGAISKAESILRQKGYLGAGEPARLADPFFREWIVTRAMPDGRSPA